MINKQSNVYTIVYITVMVIVVGAALAFTAMGLKSRQQENADADKMRQILMSVHVATDRSDVVETFNTTVTSQLIVDTEGNIVAEGNQAETPGLGAEITKPAFTDQFEGKEIFKSGQFLPVEVVKKGMKPEGDADYVDGISGGTITSKGVSAMLGDCLSPYRAYLEKSAR